ncbi:CD2 antigen cytoplasmic tail-binding protein 2 [Linum perenne]
MDGKLPRSSRKRPRQDDFEDDEPAKRSMQQKKVRFPKGKKVKPEDEAPVAAVTSIGPERVEALDGLADDARLAATKRANRRNQFPTELFEDELNGGSRAEVAYEDNNDFVDDGIQIEPFNLDKEREEGYFDAQGNFVEYLNENEFKDPWLDTVEVDTRFAKRNSKMAEDNDDSNASEMSSEEAGQIKRRIANLLEPEETVLQALRRLKGTSNGRKEKMSVETQALFDQLTEDANKLLDSGEYRGKGTLMNTGQMDLDNTEDDKNAYDMFGDDDDNTIAKTTSESNTLTPGSGSNAGGLESDYVYDEASGYYYSSSLGYYYDPNTGLYCSAASGQCVVVTRYSFNEETGAYDEVGETAGNAS